MADDRLARVISCAGAAELLDELAKGPCVSGDLRKVFPRRVFGRAVRLLAAEGAIRQIDAGSWDMRPLPAAVLALTATGAGLVRELSDLDEWVAVYERYVGP